MKLLIIGLLCLSSLSAFGQYGSRRQKPVMIITPSGPVHLNSPFNQNQKEELKGAGMEFFGRAKVKDEKVTVWIRGCKEILIGDMKETEDQAELKKLKEVRNGDNLRLRMGGFGKCEVGGWEKN